MQKRGANIASVGGAATYLCLEEAEILPQTGPRSLLVSSVSDEENIRPHAPELFTYPRYRLRVAGNFGQYVQVPGWHKVRELVDWRILKVGASGGWRWPIGVKINPTADFLLWNLSMDAVGDIKAIYRGKGREIR